MVKILKPLPAISLTEIFMSYQQEPDLSRETVPLTAMLVEEYCANPFLYQNIV